MAALVEGQAAETYCAGAGSRVVPGADEQVMGWGRLVVGQGAQLVVVVLAGDGEDGEGQGGELILGGDHAFPVSVEPGLGGGGSP